MKWKGRAGGLDIASTGTVPRAKSVPSGEDSASLPSIQKAASTATLRRK